MDKFFTLWLDSGVWGYIAITLTLLIGYIVFIAGIRTIIETAIVNAVKSIINHYFVTKTSTEIARKKIEEHPE